MEIFEPTLGDFIDQVSTGCRVLKDGFGLGVILFDADSSDQMPTLLSEIGRVAPVSVINVDHLMSPEEITAVLADSTTQRGLILIRISSELPKDLYPHLMRLAQNHEVEQWREHGTVREVSRLHSDARVLIGIDSEHYATCQREYPCLISEIHTTHFVQ